VLKLLTVAVDAVDVVIVDADGVDADEGPARVAGRTFVCMVTASSAR
jgi:hypothetical protein